MEYPGTRGAVCRGNINSSRSPTSNEEHSKNRNAGRLAISVSRFTGYGFERARLPFGASGQKARRLRPQKAASEFPNFLDRNLRLWKPLREKICGRDV